MTSRLRGERGAPFVDGGEPETVGAHGSAGRTVAAADHDGGADDHHDRPLEAREGQGRLGHTVEWLSAGEAAARLGLPVRTVLERARAGEIPCTQGPVGAPRFTVPEIEALRAASPWPAEARRHA